MKKRLLLSIGILLAYTAQAQEPCQEIIAALSTTSITPTNVSGYLYYDLCLGETIDFEGIGIYPENNTNYTQSDASSTFLWTLDDVNIEGSSASHTFNTSGTYIASLQITDNNACVSSNPIDFVIRVSTPSGIEFNKLDFNLCAGESQFITTTVLPSTLAAFPICESEESEITFLPDGVETPPGSGVWSSYDTAINLNCYDPGQELEDLDNLLRVCVVMEHSYIGDLTINLYSPDGTQVTLLPDLNGLWSGNGIGAGYLGEPVYDYADDPGVGYTYCWSPNADLGLINDVFDGGTLTESDPTTDTNIYSVYDDSFTNLLGTPLNGLWNIEITDSFPLDNGYIFSWWMDFDEVISGGLVFNDTEITSAAWAVSPIITEIDENTIEVSGATAGTYELIYTIVDELGCDYSEVLNVIISDALEMTNLTVVPDTNLLSLGSIDFDVIGGTPPYDIEWNNNFDGTSNEAVLSGTYSVSITDQWECSSAIFSINVPNYESLSLNEPQIEDFEYYINPNENTLYIESSITTYNISIHNISGQQMLSKTIHESENIPLHKLSKGLYILTIHSGENDFSQKIQIQ